MNRRIVAALALAAAIGGCLLLTRSQDDASSFEARRVAAVPVEPPKLAPTEPRPPDDEPKPRPGSGDAPEPPPPPRGGEPRPDVARTEDTVVVEGEAFDAGMPVAQFTAYVSLGGIGQGVSGENGRFSWTAAISADRRPLEGEVRFRATDRKPVRVPIRLGPGERIARAVVRFEPLRDEERATLVVEVVTDDEGFRARPFDVELRDASTEPVALRQSLTASGKGRYEGRVPPGVWWVRVRPFDGWCNHLYWEGAATLSPGWTQTVRWEVPPHGGLRFVLPERLPPGGMLLVGRKEGTASLIHLAPAPGAPSDRLLFAQREDDVSAIPVGDWLVHIVDGAHRPTRTREVRVRDGETTVVDLTGSE